MLEFIGKYWVEFLFGLIAACIIFAIKLYYSAKRKEDGFTHEALKTDILNTLDERMTIEKQTSEQVFNNLHIEIDGVRDNISLLTQGILSVQGHSFRNACRVLLRDDHEITLDEYEQVTNDHEVYHNLGGNHQGDVLFTSVMKKWNAQLAQDVSELSEGEHKE